MAQCTTKVLRHAFLMSYNNINKRPLAPKSMPLTKACITKVLTSKVCPCGPGLRLSRCLGPGCLPFNISNINIEALGYACTLISCNVLTLVVFLVASPAYFLYCCGLRRPCPPILCTSRHHHHGCQHHHAIITTAMAVGTIMPSSPRLSGGHHAINTTPSSHRLSVPQFAGGLTRCDRLLPPQVSYGSIGTGGCRSVGFFRFGQFITFRS